MPLFLLPIFIQSGLGVLACRRGGRWLASAADESGFLRIHYRLILKGFLDVLSQGA